MKKVAIQGIRGAFHEEAACRYFGDEIEIVPCMRFEELLEGVAQGVSDYGVMAVENTIAGSLNQNLVLLDRNDVHIIGEVSIRIKQSLGALPGQSIGDIKEVMSHHMALLQSRVFLSKLNGIRLVEIADTALGAKRIADERLRSVGAIGSVRAMQHYGLEVLADEIETNKLNHTRFFVVRAGKETIWETDALKSTVHLTLPSRPGSLYEVLGVFYNHNINLTKIESIPIEGQPYHYGFIIDCEFDAQDDLRVAIDDLNPVTEDLQILGVYKTSPKD